MIRKILFIVISLFVFFDTSFSQVFSGTTAAQFLKIEVGAKSIGMGGAFVSVANDASALYWNPAGIARLQNNNAMFSHTFWLAGTNHDFAGVILKLSDQQAIGFSYTSLTVGDMAVRTEMFPDGTGEYFNAADFSIGLSYGLNLTDMFSIGFTGKYVGERIWHMSASAMAFDVGILYTTPVRGLNLGMSISNIGSKIHYTGRDNFINYSFDPNQHGNSSNIFASIQMDSWNLPMIFRVGLSMKFIDNDMNKLTMSVDANYPNDYNEYLNLGCEYGFMKRFFLRVGYKSLFKLNSEEGLTAGIGFVYYITDENILRFDYS
ncbi:MAG: PorV/PorQ family protein, partial [Ignavibacteriaceae bacterium]